MDERERVEAANTAFYRAFEALELAGMDAVWAHGDHVECIHPGWARLTGWPSVRASWAAIFENTAEMRFTLTDVRARIVGAVAWVTCTENIFSEVAGRVGVTAILATNLFERDDEVWRLVHHHGSHVLVAPPRPPS